MNANQWTATLERPIVPGRDHIRGSLSAATKVVEYGDYECPACRAAHPDVTALQAQLRSRICFVYRHFPLTTVHPHAATAAEAAEAAGNQHKFWVMHDRLFTVREPLTYDTLISSARALELDVAKFALAIQRHVYLERVRDDFMGGVSSGVNGTPTFYINGYRHDGAWDFASLLAAIQRNTGALVPARRK
jgi:protein-disulfide isomerase